MLNQDTMLGRIQNFFGISLDKKQLLWNVFLTMERSFTVDTSGVNWKIEVPWTDYKFEGSFVDRGISQSPIFKIFHISRDNSRIAAAEVIPNLSNPPTSLCFVRKTLVYDKYQTFCR